MNVLFISSDICHESFKLNENAVSLSLAFEALILHNFVSLHLTLLVFFHHKLTLVDFDVMYIKKVAKR